MLLVRILSLITESMFLRTYSLTVYILNAGGASFAASFGPGRYRAYTCVDFRISGPTSSLQHVAPEEYGVWLADFPIRNSVSPEQVYYGVSTFLVLLHSSIHRELHLSRLCV